MTGVVECGTHGKVRPAFVCGHLIETLRDGVARGLVWCRDEAGNVNAYCGTCDRVLEQAGGDWTRELEAQANIQLICEMCFRLVERANGQGGDA